MTSETTDEFTDLSNYIVDETPDLYADYSYLQVAQDDEISSCPISSEDQATVEAALASLQPDSNFFGTAAGLVDDIAGVSLGTTAAYLKSFEGATTAVITKIGTYVTEEVTLGEGFITYVYNEMPVLNSKVTPSSLPAIGEVLEHAEGPIVITDAVTQIAASQDHLTAANMQMISKGTALLVAEGLAAFFTDGLSLAPTVAHALAGVIGVAWSHGIEANWSSITSIFDSDKADSKTDAQIGADVCSAITDDVQAIFDSTGSAATANLTGMATLVPGVGSVAKNLAQDLGVPPPPLTGAIEDALTKYGAAPHETDPLVVDLSTAHTGITLTTYNAATTTTFYDLDNTGFAEQTAWTSGTTGFLVQQNTDGTISLFGNTGGDGFADLAKLDTDHNLKIDANDSAWSSLKVWVDSDGDGVEESGELQTLSSAGIVSVDLAGLTSSTSTIDGNAISHTSTVTFSDGSTAAIDDAHLVNSAVNTYYDGDYTLDPDTLFLPDLRGYGTLPELAVAMSQDSTLKSEVADFATAFGTSGFASFTDSDVANILYEWAGVAGVASDARGSFVDARQLEFLEHIFGQSYFQLETQSPNPQSGTAAQDIDASWNMVLEQFKDQLVLQAGGSSLFTNPITYDPMTGTVSGETSLSHAGVTALDDNAPSPGAENVAYWVQIAHFLDTIAGLSTLTSTENGWLNDAVQASDSSLTWADVKSAIAESHPGSDITGTTGNDVLYGLGTDDSIVGDGGHDLIYTGDGNVTVTIGADSSTVFGGAGTDTIYGGDGGDTIHLGDGTNTLYGGAGNDTVYGGAGIDTVHLGDGNNVIHLGTGGEFVFGNSGNDTYYYEGGNALITENGGSNLIILPSGITSADVSFWEIGNTSADTFDDLLIQINDGTTVGSIQIRDQFSGYSSSEIQTLEFSDSSTIDLTSLTNMTWALTGGETVSVPSGSGNVDAQLSNGGNTLTLHNGTNTVEFISGNNHVNGGSGDDTYFAGPGFNVIDDTAGTNTIQIPTGFTMDDVSISLVAGTQDMLITIAGLGEIKITDEFYDTGYGIQNFHFMGDDSTVALSSLSIDTIGTSGNNSLSGESVNIGGNWFDGRGGNDSFSGGIGDNTFNFNSGFGTDTISLPHHTGNTNTIAFHGVDAADIRMWTTSNGDLHLQDTTDTSHSITVSADVTGSGSSETAIGGFLEQIKFDDSTTWDLTGGLTLTGTNSGGNIYGSAYGDMITGGTGTDNLFGNGGNDTIVSGGGSDGLYGGTGNDTYVFASGFGSSTIYDNSSSGANVIHLTGLDPADIRLWTDVSGNLHLQDTTNPSYNITVDGGETGSGTHESTIGTYFSSVTFDSGYSTTWDLTGGLTQSLSNSGGNLYATGNGDSLNGGTGADSFFCNAGDNTVYGGGGSDTAYLGSGADTILFKAATAETGVETIYSFDTGKGDKLDISDMISTYDPLTMDISHFVELTTSAGNTQVKVDTDGSGTSYTQIATLSGVTGLNLNDLITDGNLIVHHT